MTTDLTTVPRARRRPRDGRAALTVLAAALAFLSALPLL